jgi:hypothetical protein
MQLSKQRLSRAWVAAAVALLAVPNVVIAMAGTRASQSDDRRLWKQIQPGASWQGIEFTKQREVRLTDGGSTTTLFTFPNAGENYATVGVSPPDPSGKYVIVVGEGDDEKPGWIVDKEARRATRLTLPVGVDDFSEWSSDGKHVVLHTNLAEGPDQLWVLDAPELQVREVHRAALKAGVKSCCGLSDWAKAKDEEGRVDEDTVQWRDAKSFSFRLWTRCNPFSIANCSPGRELSAYSVTVDVDSGKVTERRVPTHER